MIMPGKRRTSIRPIILLSISTLSLQAAPVTYSYQGNPLPGNPFPFVAITFNISLSSRLPSDSSLTSPVDVLEWNISDGAQTYVSSEADQGRVGFFFLFGTSGGTIDAWAVYVYDVFSLSQDVRIVTDNANSIVQDLGVAGFKDDNISDPIYFFDPNDPGLWTETAGVMLNSLHRRRCLLPLKFQRSL